eukprot:409472_1
MYRIPPLREILRYWGQQDADFQVSLHMIGDGEVEKAFIHASFWRQYHSDSDEYDEWKVFVSSNDDLYPDSLCFLSIGSFDGGEYPYAVASNSLPGFYIDTQHLVNIHCYELDEIKVDCGQDWSWPRMSKQQFVEQQQDLQEDTDTHTSMDDDDEVDHQVNANDDVVRVMW